MRSVVLCVLLSIYVAVADAQYTWQTGAFTQCSRVCGGGSMTRPVTCISLTGTQVSNSFCENLGLTAPASFASCNVQTCTAADYIWSTGQYTPCSAQCGGGISTRTIQCLDRLGNPATASFCTSVGSAQPVTQTTCNTRPCGFQPVYPRDFPVNIDGTVIFAKTLKQSDLTGLAATQLKRTGPSQFDAICDAAVPGSYAIVCSSTRNALTYFTYATGAQGAPFNGYARPVYAFNANARPTAYVPIAASPVQLFANGLDLSGAAARSFTDFYDETGRTNQTTGPNQITGRLNSTITWTGCREDGSVYINTCIDWTDNRAFATNQIYGASGLAGGYTTAFGTTIRNWLFSGTSYECNRGGYSIYCSWNPTAFDGIQNGDETSVDCGGRTLRADGTLAGTCAQCPPGSTGPDGSVCQECRSGTYKPQFGNFPCVPCTPIKSYSPGGSSFCVCQPGYTQQGTAVDGSTCEPITVKGDPQIVGIQGQDFQVHGVPDDIFNMISTPDFQVNSRFIFLNKGRCLDNVTACYSHPGTYIDQIGMLVAGQRIQVDAGSYEQGLTVKVDDKPIVVSKHLVPLVQEGSSIQFISKRKVIVRTPLFQLALVNSDGFMNQEAVLLDNTLMKKGAMVYKIKQDTECPFSDVQIHGILGQTWKNCQYPGNRFIQGEVNDYHIEDNDLFGTAFEYNMYQL